VGTAQRNYKGNRGSESAPGRRPPFAMKIGTEQVMMILLRKKRSEVVANHFGTPPELDFDSRSQKSDPRTEKSSLCTVLGPIDVRSARKKRNGASDRLRSAKNGFSIKFYIDLDIQKYFQKYFFRRKK